MFFKQKTAYVMRISDWSSDVYSSDLHAAGEIIVRGSSAGGNLAAALMLRARDEGLPFPAGLVLATPELDLTESGDSFQTNEGIDVVLKGSLMAANLLYAAGQIGRAHV